MANVIRFLVLGFFATTATAQDSSIAADNISDDEAQLVEICNEMNMNEAFSDRDRSSAFVKELLEFEQSHRGTHAGLMAARRLVLLGGGGGLLNNPRDIGRRKALGILSAYSDNEILPEILRYLSSGNPDVASEACLREIIAETSVGQNRLFAQYMLARWILDMRDSRESIEQRLAEIAKASEPGHTQEKDYLVNRLEAGIPEGRIPELEREAIALLSLVSRDNSTSRQPAVAGADKNCHIIRLDKTRTETMPLIRDVASGMLFKEQHLRVGKRAPELTVQLVNDLQWSISGNQGKTLVIQFSFKGCGPCEAMYPDLRALTEQYADQLSILSIMADQKLADTTEVVETGKITWNVAWDGSRGPIATQWAVQRFPTVYVIGPDGTVAGVGLRGDALRKKIAQLAE